MLRLLIGLLPRGCPHLPWGLTLVAEFTVRVILVFTLSVAQVLALWPVVTMGASIGLMLWNLAYG